MQWSVSHDKEACCQLTITLPFVYVENHALYLGLMGVTHPPCPESRRSSRDLRWRTLVRESNPLHTVAPQNCLALSVRIVENDPHLLTSLLSELRLVVLDVSVA